MWRAVAAAVSLLTCPQRSGAAAPPSSSIASTSPDWEFAGGAIIANGAAPTTLLVEYWSSPAIGVDRSRPRFSWTLSSAARGVGSAAYQIVVTDGAAATAWDSAKVASDANQVECGVELKPDTAYEWKVRWWSAAGGAPSPFSAPAQLRTGLFSAADWMSAAPIDTGVQTPAAVAVNSTTTRARARTTASPCAKPGACQMVSTITIMKTDGYFMGVFNASLTHSVDSIPDCIAACEASPACVQITWAPSHYDKCVTYTSISPGFAGGAQGWVKLSGRFIRPAAAGPCPVKGYPDGCPWFESFADSAKHFVSDCKTFPKACGAAQKSCWPDWDGGLPIIPVNESYLTSLKTASNFSCTMYVPRRRLLRPPKPTLPPSHWCGDSVLRFPPRVALILRCIYLPQEQFLHASPAPPASRSRPSAKPPQEFHSVGHSGARNGVRFWSWVDQRVHQRR